MIIDIQIDDSFSRIQSLAKILAIIHFANDTKKAQDFELGILAGLESAGLSDMGEVLMNKTTFARLIEAVPLDTLQEETHRRVRECWTIHHLVDLMIRANASDGVVAERNSLNRAVSVLPSIYKNENIPLIHGTANIIKTWAKWKYVAHFIFAYYEFLGATDENDPDFSTDLMLMNILLLADIAGQSLKSINTLKLDGQLCELPDTVNQVLNKMRAEMSPIQPTPLTPDERKIWLAYRSNYVGKN